MGKVPSWVWNKYKPNKIINRDTSDYDSKLESKSHTISKPKKSKHIIDGQLRLDI